MKRLGRGQMAGEIGRHGFGGLAARRKNQNGSEIFGERLCDEPRPVTVKFARDMVI